MFRRSFAWLLPCALFLAGCVSSAGDIADSSPSVQVDGGGMVLGLVISEELFPVAGAEVAIDGLFLAQTDESGSFAIPNVAPGPHTLSVNATGYEPFSMEFELLEGEGAELRVGLIGIPGKAPYARTIIHDGFSACSFSAVYSAQSLPSGSSCPFGAPKGGPKVEVTEDWVAGVHELSWRTQEDMIFASSVGTENLSHGSRRAGCITNGVRWDWCPAMVWGKSPLRIFARPNDTEYAKKYAIDGKETWPGGENYTSWIFSSYSGYARKEVNQTGYPVCAEINAAARIPRHWGCPFGIGYSLGIKLTYYHTTFYLQPPGGRLEDFTALPDG